MNSTPLTPKMEKQCNNTLKLALKCFENKNNSSKDCEKTYLYTISCIKNKINYLTPINTPVYN